MRWSPASLVVPSSLSEEESGLWWVQEESGLWWEEEPALWWEEEWWSLLCLGVAESIAAGQSAAQNQ